MAYTIYLGDLQLPIPPDKITHKFKNQNTTINLMNDSEINILKSPGLRDISFTVLLPSVDYPFAVYPDGFHRSWYYFKRIKKLKEDKKPFTFTIYRNMPNKKGKKERPLFSTSFLVSLEDFKVTESADLGFDLSIEINLKEYKKYGAKSAKIINSTTLQPSEPERSTESKPEYQTYTVQKGDCLWLIAQKTLGNGSRHNELYEYNKELIDNANKGTGCSVYTIYAGQVFTIPN